MVLHWVNRSGTGVGETPLDVTGQNPTLSPDGRLLALDVMSGSGSLKWVADVERGVTSRITHGGGQDRSPAWSPDGRRIAFSRGKKLFVTAADGSGNETELANLDGSPESWSPDGQYLLYRTQRQLFVWPLAGRAPAHHDGDSFPLTRARSHTHPTSRGGDEVYIQRHRPHPGVCAFPPRRFGAAMGRTSSELMFLAANRTMTMVDVRIGDTIAAGS